ncbi:O79 family O-antigen flippase [Escherichia coli]|uniref:O79 family O-antigen flippase n=1 Tax=Escherichia coli TaxID=562 RepID=UPI000BE15FFB|nr:O79 family O-antigen flippase [Escherichia coli]
MRAGAIVFLRNLLIAVSGFILVSKGVKNLSEADTAFLLLVMLVINAQNALYEGLFLVHTMSFKDKCARTILKRQNKIQVLIPVLAIIFVLIYSNIVLDISIGYGYVALLYFCFYGNILSISVVNVFCSIRGFTWCFILDIVFTTAFIILSVTYSSRIILILALLLRVGGSAFAGLIFQVRYKKSNDKKLLSLPLYSMGYFSGTLLSLFRDTLSPLLIGWFVGPSILIAIRIFNTCYSAPGLFASALNKIIVRYARKKQSAKKVFITYLIGLYVLSIGYLLIWYIGGERLYLLLFGKTQYFPQTIFLYSISLFCLFWPLGQTAITGMIFTGSSRLFFIVSIIWTFVSAICIFILFIYGIEFYMLAIAFSQMLNILIVYLVRKNGTII